MNKEPLMDVPNHTTIFNQSECIISPKLGFKLLMTLVPALASYYDSL